MIDNLTDSSSQPKIKMDYTIESPAERVELVKKIIENTPEDKINQIYINSMSNYIVYAMDKQEKKGRKIITPGRQATLKKYDISFEGLVAEFENGEDGIYNLIINDKNQLLSNKEPITEKDIAEVPGLKQLKDSIESVKADFAAASGKRKYLLKKQIIEMSKDQYVLRESFRHTIGKKSSLAKSMVNLDLYEDITFDENLEPNSTGLITLFNPNHVELLLCNYASIKEETYAKFSSDLYYLIMDLENLIDKTLKINEPILFDILVYKIDGKSNQEIQDILKRDYKVNYTFEHISSLWRKKIPKYIADKAKEDYINWYFNHKECGKWKRCSRCGQIKLAHNRYFSKNNTSKDKFYSICKECRNKKK